MAELAAIPLPDVGPMEWTTPEGWTVPISPEYVRTIVAVNEVFPGMRVHARRDLRAL